MTSADVLIDGYDRIREAVHQAVDGLDEDDLAYRVDPGANSIAWLIWHLARVQDDHIAELAEREQVWTDRGWYERFGLRLDRRATGFGDGPGDVAEVVAPAELLVGYYDAVHEQTLRFIRGLADDDLAKIIDTRWDPPVTLGVRLVSVLADDLQHAGQAAYLRGHLRRR
ncbi:mycothiol transferase [Nocardia donostiensis]|uniref:Chorismate synthase n=1 Tax=Nocardia donostiensis TaxID=1538463 RepID=A0A1W0ARY8_9NOCA|nr:DUF664 domain-containing protein [Nocardia donostiensis]ONM48802.1 hypothetical protein B0T46_09935 [Nocardia donostiensis]OQS12998.1 hypothetical protein B0T36_22020 [Nocardia donostiensis]OQS22943.1 hypothetical protein B0T44_04530 [Nocardia donostiensis]